MEFAGSELGLGQLRVGNLLALKGTNRAKSAFSA
jgi:hypothetical protein